jgi:hypothetical protein
MTRRRDIAPWATLLLALTATGCVRAREITPDTASPPRDGARDLVTDGASTADRAARDGSAAVQVSQLVAGWSTPTTIRWEWKVSGPAAALRDYTLVVGPTEADVLKRASTTITWTAKENPELGYHTIPDTVDLVLATTTDGHLPATRTCAQLVATDTDGRASATAVACGQTTAATTHEAVVFSEADTAGYSIPATFVYSDSGAYLGTHCYRFDSKCTGGAKVCFENLRRQAFKVPLAIDSSAFATTAFYEVAVACSGDHSLWSQARLMFSDGTKTTLYVYNVLTIRCDGKYRLWQIPLRVFHDSSKPLSASELTTHWLFEFTVGGNWSDGARVYVDEVRIRW